MRRVAFFLVGFVTFAAARQAAAQPNERRAAQLAEEGVALYRQAAYERAIAKFEESYRLVPDPVNLFNVGKCYERMNRFEEAIRAYRRYIVEAENAADRQEVEQRITNIEGRPARVNVSSNPRGATVYVDDTSGEPAGVTPLVIELPAGQHILTFRLDGYEQSTRPVAGGYGREVNLDIALAPVATVGGGGGVTAPAAPEAKALHLGANVGVGLGSVGTEVTLTPTIALGIRLGYGIQLATKLFIDIAVAGNFEPRQAGDPVHSLSALTALLEPTLRLQLADQVFLNVIGGIGAMNLIGLEKGDEFFEDPEASSSGALLTFLDVRAAVGVWVMILEDLGVSATLGLDYSPAVPGILGDFVRFGGTAGAIYRF